MTVFLRSAFLLFVVAFLWGCADKTQIASGPVPAASLSGLTISGTTLSPAFSPDTLTYTASVPHTTDSITVTPTATDSNATITVNGVVVPTGATSPPIPLSVGENILSIVVTEPDGTTKTTYTVTVTRVPSVDAALSALTLSDGSLVPVFDTNVLNYAASVAHATDTVTVTPTANDPAATITVNGVAVASGSASQPIPLVVGDNAINILVTAQDNSAHTNYVVTVARAPSADALLASLSLSEGTLNPAFDSGVLNYTATVPYATDSLTVTATTDDPNATLAVDGLPVTSGTASQSLPLTVGTNAIEVKVTAQDGSTSSPYVITVTREPSDDAALASLTLSSGSLKPDFKISELNYTASVTHQTDSITVTPTADDPNATITVNGITVASGTASQAIPLVVGDNVINVLVTAQDLATHANYSITVTRAASSDATLSTLTLSSGVLIPGFQPGVLSYTADVANATDTITVTPTATEPGATILINGIHVDSGTTSQPFPLTVGSNPLNIVVTAPDTTTSTTYVLTVNRAPSSDALLSSLTVSNGNLDQAFDPKLLVYTESVIHTVDSITVTPTADDPTATITVDGAPVSSGTASAPISLAVGDNVITILVTAQDGVTTATYTITVTRAPSTDATLKALAISSGTLLPGFQPTVLSYTATVPNATSSITLTPTANDAGATITVNGTAVASGTASQAISLSEGAPNTITIVVTAGDGSTTTTYTLKVTRLSDSAFLFDLKLFDNASPGTQIPLKPFFDSSVLSYTASVTSDVRDVYVVATLTSDSIYSEIKVNGVVVTSSFASQPVTLVTGDTVIDVVVTAQDGVTQSTYTITVTRPASTVASLSDLSLSSGIAVPLKPQFDTTTLSYTAKVDNATNSVTVTPTSTDDRATIEVNGQAVVSGNASGPISLSNGVNAIIIVVTAEDGSTQQAYFVEVIREWASFPVQTLKATTIDPGAQFGFAVAIDGDTMVIGAPQDNDTGAAYVFNRDPVTGDWTQADVLQATVPQNGSNFGFSVDIQGDTIVVGAHLYDLTNSLTNAGNVYVFRRINSTDWQRTQTLTTPTPAPSGAFGSSVSIDGNTIVIGAPKELNNKGIAHVFVCDAAFSQCLNEAALTAADGANGDLFGNAVAIDGDRVAVGAPFNAAGGTRRGAVYVFERASSVWSQAQKLEASNAGDDDWFGNSVALDGDTLVAGAPNEDSGFLNNPADNSKPQSGAAYVFTRETAGWSESEYLKAPIILQGLEFGFSVAIDNGNLVISAPYLSSPTESGLVYVFAQTSTSWISTGGLFHINQPNAFGRSVDIDGDTIVVGEPLEDTNGDDSGAVNVFE